MFGDPAEPVLGKNSMSKEDIFDEAWYRRRYPDVARAIQQGTVPTGEAHYDQFGRSEGREFRTRKAPEGRIFSYGAYGSNNVGDEAILEGVRLHHPESIQLHVIHPREGTGASVDYNEAKEAGFFKKGDHLILGGGGLLYSREVVALMTLLARRVTQAGGTVDILRIGCEAAHPDFHDAIRELFSLARIVSVRSSISQKIISDICGIEVPFEDDFAMELRPQVASATGSGHDIPVIGLVLASIKMPHLQRLAKQLERFLYVHVKRRGVRFVLIPHSRSFFDAENNDCITAEILSTFYRNPNDFRVEDFVAAPFSADPYEVLKAYSRLDGVISSRYHGLIFANLVGLPTLALSAGLIKIKSFVDDHPSDLMTQSLWPEQDDLKEKLTEFVGAVTEWRKLKSHDAA